MLFKLFPGVVSSSEREKMSGMPEHSSWKEAELFLGTTALRLFALLKKVIITYLNPEIPGVFHTHVRPVAGSWGWGLDMVIAGQERTTFSLLHNTDSSVPSSRKVKSQLYRQQTTGRAICGGGAGFRVNFPKGQVWTWGHAPASLLKNSHLLRFKKCFIVVCWFCLGPVTLGMAGSERRGKMC